MSDQNIILTGVRVYLLVMISIGVISARRASVQATDFMLAGRKLPLWLCTATIMATWLGGGSMLGVSGQTYEGGLLDVIADPFGAALGIFLVGLFVIRLARRLQLVTVIDFFLMRFGRPATMVAAFAIVLSGVAWAGALMVAFGTILNVLTGVPLVWGILIGGLIVVGYTAIGGMWAVAMTDLIQLIVMILGLVILTTIVVLDMGGVSAAWSQIPAEKLNLLPLENDAPSWLNYLRAWFIIGVSNLASQSLLQRGLAAKDERTAQWAYYFGAVGFLIIGLIPALLGILASVTMPGVEDKQTLLPLLAEAHLHPLLMALFVGAVLAAIMSSADSALLRRQRGTETSLGTFQHPHPRLGCRWYSPAISSHLRLDCRSQRGVTGGCGGAFCVGYMVAKNQSRGRPGGHGRSPGHLAERQLYRPGLAR